MPPNANKATDFAGTATRSCARRTVIIARLPAGCGGASGSGDGGELTGLGRGGVILHCAFCAVPSNKARAVGPVAKGSVQCLLIVS